MAERLEAQVVDTAQVLAPVDMEPCCTRERILAPPDWRYQEATRYLAEEKDGMVPTAPSDPVVQYAIRALRSCVSGTGNYGRKFMYSLWPLMEEVLYFGVTAKRSAITSEMEACMIRGMDWAAARSAGCPVRRDVYELYARLFFDLSGIRAVHSWVQDFLFEPERHSQSKSLLRARILAYVGNSGTGKLALTGMLDNDSQNTMKKFIQNERQKQLFDYMAGKSKLPVDIYADIMEAAVKSMSEHDFQEHMKDRDEAGSGSLEELAEHMEEGIRAYSQAELASPASDGLDFVNQYTKLLTRKKDG